MFHANTNATLKNLEIQVRKLALNMQNQSRDSFPSDTEKNPKDCMAITLRSGKELQDKKEVEKIKLIVKLRKHIKMKQVMRKSNVEMSQQMKAKS